MNTLWEALLELIYPHPVNCPFCDRVLSSLGPVPCCADCARELAHQRAGPICRRCGKFLHGELGPFSQPLFCLDCQMSRPTYTLARAVGPYEGRLKEVVHRLKYQKKRWLARPLGQLIAEAVQGEPAFGAAEVVVPVPLHQAKYRRRGFNQAELLGQTLARELGLPFGKGALVRLIDTPAQTELGREERQHNLTGAFAVKQPTMVREKRVLLVDDVLTTGSTAGECSRVLMEAGARQVLVAVVAAGRGK
ncbi:MAG: ComF family protein [Firmicutes bacterium]|nr:ComF family protein [Bacillota bacterium]